MADRRARNPLTWAKDYRGAFYSCATVFPASDGRMFHVCNPTHNVCMASLHIRNVPDEVSQRLKARTAKRGQSLNSYLLEVIQSEVERPTANEVLARAAARSEPATISSAGVLKDARTERQSR